MLSRLVRSLSAVKVTPRLFSGAAPAGYKGAPTTSFYPGDLKTNAVPPEPLEEDGDTKPLPNRVPLSAENVKEILAHHPDEHPVDVLDAYSFPRNVMLPIEGPFGTWRRPALVPSGKDSRIVACTGGYSQVAGYGMFHPAMWLQVNDNGKNYECDECGQVFKLLRLKGTNTAQEHHDHEHGHSHSAHGHH